MFNNKRKVVLNTIGIIIFIGIFIFSYFRYSRYRKGPEIVSINIEKYMSVESPSLSIDAMIKNTKEARINGRDIILNNKVNFNEIVVFSSGNNIIEIVLTDTFGKIKSHIYNIYYKQDIDSIPRNLKKAKEILEEEVTHELIEINE